MLEEFKGAIFDLDGVIVDTAKYHYLAWKRLADELGIPFTLRDNERLKGVSRMRSLEIILELGNKKLTEQEMNRLADQKNRWYVEYIEKIDESELLKGAREYIAKLKEQGKKISLGSASKNALTILNRLHIADLFDCIVDGTKVTKAKPDPEVFTLGACGMGLIPPDCVVFEDAEAGIQAAKNAGMRAVGIGDPDRLIQADMVVKGLFELL